MTWNVRNLIFPQFQCTSITNRVFTLFDRFTTYYNCKTRNVRKLISPPFQRISITNRVFRLFNLLMAYYNIMTLNLLKTHISAICAQVSQIVFFAYLTVLQLITTLWPWNVRKLISPRFQYTSIRKRFLSLFDRFTTSYNCMTWNVRKLISPPFQCTSITKRFLSLFVRFTTCYSCMTWNVRKLISPPF